MKILVSNDDGISSEGISALVNELKKIGDVIVVAPATEQSAAGHSITMKIPLRVKEHYINGELFGYAVDGTPADCIKMGIKNILKEKPDVVVSGINNGSNAAINVIYSGTVSAAREAAIMNVPAIAISVASHKPNSYKYSAKIAAQLVQFICNKNLGDGTLLNVNVPDLPEEEIKGILLTRQSTNKWDDYYEERTDPYGGKYYWLKGEMEDVEEELDRDVVALKNGYISVTPIHFDLTDFKRLEIMKSWDINSLKNN